MSKWAKHDHFPDPKWRAKGRNWVGVEHQPAKNCQVLSLSFGDFWGFSNCLGLFQVIMENPVSEFLSRNFSGQIVTTFPAEVTPNGGLVRESPQKFP